MTHANKTLDAPLRRCFLAAILACPLFAGSRASAQAVPGATPGEVIGKMIANYAAFGGLKDLDLQYRLTNEFLGKKPKVFAFEECDFRCVKGDDRLRVEFRGIRDGAKNRPKTLIRKASWDGKVGMKVISDDHFVYIGNRVPEVIYYNNLYVDYLGSPDATGSVSRALGKLSVGEPDYWVPETLRSNREKFTLARDESGEGLHVLEWKDRDRYWVDLEHGCRIVRRDLYYPSGGLLRERTLYSEFTEVGPTSLPFKVVREIFSTPQDDRKLWNQPVEVNTIEVVAARTDVLPAGSFRLPIQEGDTVTDMVRRLQYKKVGSDKDMLAASVTIVERKIPNRGRLYLAISIVAPMALLAAILSGRRFFNHGGSGRSEHVDRLP